LESSRIWNNQDRKTPLETSSQIENEIDAGHQIYYPRAVSKSGNGCHSNLHVEEPLHVQDRVDAWGKVLFITLHSQLLFITNGGDIQIQVI
jgi:hypothetical protein